MREDCRHPFIRPEGDPFSHLFINLLRIFLLNNSHLHTRVSKLAWLMLANNALVVRGLMDLNVGQRICLLMDQFYRPKHSVAIFVFPVNMAPFSLCFYLFYILLKVGQRGQVTKLLFFILIVRLGPCGCCSEGLSSSNQHSRLAG